MSVHDVVHDAVTILKFSPLWLVFKSPSELHLAFSIASAQPGFDSKEAEAAISFDLCYNSKPVSLLSEWLCCSRIISGSFKVPQGEKRVCLSEDLKVHA